MKQLPLYEQIYNDIIEGIENGTYKKETGCRLKKNCRRSTVSAG